MQKFWQVAKGPDTGGFVKRAGVGAVEVDELEGVVLDDYPGDERFDELGAVLALYSPGQGTPYTDVDELHAAIREASVRLE